MLLSPCQSGRQRWWRWPNARIACSLYGEFIAVEAYGLEPAPRGANGYDAKTPDGKTVQVKANFAASQIGFRGEADLLLCLKIDLNGDWTELYYGNFQLVKQASRHSARDNKSMIAISALTRIKAAGYKMPEQLPVTTPDATADDEPI